MTVKAKGDKSEYYLDVDLEKDMGINIPMTDAASREVGRAIIDAIISRTRDQGRPLTGGKFADYSEAYAKKKGVGVSDVDLTLFGDMLDSLSVTGISGKKIRIESDDPFQTPKMFNHNTGDTLPKREFFGILSTELENIKDSMRERIETSSGADRQIREQDSGLAAIAEALIKGIDFRGR